MTLPKRGTHLFGPPEMTWRRARARACGLEAVLIAITVGNGATDVGADIPLPFLEGIALLFPASLLFGPMVGLLRGFTGDMTAMAIAAAIVVGVQFIALTVLFKRPWR